MAEKLVEIKFAGKDYFATGWYYSDKSIEINKGSQISLERKPSLCSGGLRERLVIEELVDNARKLIKNYKFNSASACISAFSGSNDGPRKIKTSDGMSLADFINTQALNIELSEIETNAIKYLESETYVEERKTQAKVKKDWDKFLKRFSRDKIMGMSLLDYCEGTPKTKSSFCYILEWGELEPLGSIRNATADTKFGVHFYKDLNKYTFHEKWGKSVDEAFMNVKKEICNLLDACEAENYKAVEENKLSEMFKTKLCFVYFNERFIPVYSAGHLDFFMKALKIPCEIDKTTPFEKRSLLLNYKNDSPILSKMTNIEFGKFLYSEFGFKKETTIMKKTSGFFGSQNETQEIELVEISALENKEHKDKKNIILNKPDYISVSKCRMKAGEDAEMKVLEFERKNNKKFAKMITRVSGESDSYHYDIKSFDQSGKEIHIEVKTKTSGSIGDIDFHISRLELQKLKEDPLYVIYYLIGLRTKNVKIIKIKPNMLNEVELIPDSYHVTAKAIILED